MAMGNGNKQDDNVVYFLSERSGKKFDSPHFVVKTKDDTGAIVESTTVKEYSGNLLSVKFGKKYNEKTPKGLELANQYGNRDVVRVTLKDEELKEVYSCEFGFSMMTRSFFNSLLNLNTFNNLKVGIYRDKNGYDKLSLRQDDEMVKWKFQMTEIPEIETMLFKGKELKDYDKVDTFFLSKLQEKFGQTITENNVKNENQKKHIENTIEENEEVPF